MKRKKVFGTIALSLAALLAIQQFAVHNVYAAENTVYNAVSVPSGESVGLTNSPLLAMELPRNIKAGSYVDLKLEGAEWNLPNPSGTLQALFGSKTAYESKVNDRRAVPYVKTVDLEEEIPDDTLVFDEFEYETANNGFISNKGVPVSRQETTGTIMSSFAEVNPIQEKHKAGLVGDMTGGYDMLANVGYIVYSYDSTIVGSSALRWTSSVPGTVTIADDTRYGYGVKLTRLGIGSSIIKVESKNEEGNWELLHQFTVNCPDMTDTPFLDIDFLSNISSVGDVPSIFVIESDKAEASIKITPKNTVDGITFTSSDPDLTIQVSSNLVKFVKPTNLAVNKLVTVTVKTGTMEMATYIVRLMANKVSTIQDIIINGEGIAKIGVNAIQAISDGGASLTGTLAIKTNKGLAVGNKVDWVIEKSADAYGDLIYSPSSIVTSDNQVVFSITGLTFHEDYPVTYKIKGYVGSDKIIEFFMYASNQAGKTIVSVQKPALSTIKVGTEYNFVLPSGEKEGLLTATCLIEGVSPSNFTWKIDNTEAATIELSGTNLTVKKNQYLSETVPVTITVIDPDTNFTLYSFTVLLEVAGSSSSKITFAPAAGSGILAGVETNFILPSSITAGELQGTFDGVIAGNINWTTNNPSLLQVAKNGNNLTLTRLSLPAEDTIVTFSSDNPISTFSVLVKAKEGGGGGDEEPIISVSTQTGSNVTFDETANRFILPASAANGTIAITKPSTLDPTRITWSSSEPSYVLVSANGANTVLTVRRVGNNGSTHLVTISGKVDGAEVISFDLFDEGGPNIDSTGSEIVTFSKGNGMGLDTNGDFIIESFNSYGVINIAKSGFSANTTLRFTTSRPDLVAVSLNTEMTELTLTRKVSHVSAEIVTVNVIVNDITTQTIKVTLNASTLIGDGKASFTTTPISEMQISEGIFISGSNQEVAEFNIEYYNCNASEVTWATYTAKINLEVSGGILKIVKIPGVTVQEIVEIIATRSGTPIGSFRVRVYPTVEVIDKEIGLEPVSNFTAGQSVDFVMEKDSSEGEFLINYMNYSPNELSWEVDSDAVKLETKGTQLVLKRQRTIPSMELVTVSANSVLGNIVTYTILIPATDVEVNLLPMKIDFSTGLVLDEASGKYLVKSRTFTVMAVDNSNIPLPGVNMTTTSSKVNVSSSGTSHEITIADDFSGEFTINATLSKYSPIVATFVVSRMATSEIYLEVKSGANYNIGSNAYTMTGTTSILKVSDYNDIEIGGLVISCSDPYVAAEVQGTEMTVVVAEGYEREFSVLLTANGFDSKTLTFVPKAFLEPGIYLVNTGQDGWFKTGQREWTLPEGETNTSFTVKMNPTAVGKAKVSQVDANGIRKQLPVSYAAGGTQFTVNVPATGNVEHTLVVSMNNQEREFTLIFEGDGGDTEDPVAFHVNPFYGFVETETGVLRFTHQYQTGAFTVYESESSQTKVVEGTLQQSGDKVSYKLSNIGMWVFELNEILTEDYICYFTVMDSNGNQQTLELIFPNQTGISTGYFTVESIIGTNLVDDEGVYYAMAGTANLNMHLKSTDKASSLLFMPSSDLISLPQMANFDPISGEMMVPATIGLTTADKIVTINIYAIDAITGSMVPAGSIRVKVPKNNSGGGGEEDKVYTGALSDFHYQQTAPNIIRITLLSDYSVDNGDKLYIPMLVTSKTNNGAKVSVMSPGGGTSITEGTYDFLLTAKSGTTTKIESIKNFFSSTSLSDITISENGPNILKTGKITLTIDDGFSFEAKDGQTAVTFTGVLGNTMTKTGTFNIKNNVAEIEILEIAGLEAERQGKLGSIIINGLEISRDKKTEDVGKITMKIEGAGVSKTSLTVAIAVAEEVNLSLGNEKEDLPTLVTGHIVEDATDQDIETAEFIVQGSLADAKKLSLNFAEGVIVRAVEVVDKEGVSGVDVGDIAYSKDNDDYDKTMPISVNENSIGLSDLDYNEGEETYITLKAFVTLSADFDEEELVVVSSTSDEEEDGLAIASVNSPVSVSMEDTIMPTITRDKEVNLPDFVIKEAVGGSLNRTADTVADIFDDPTFVDETFVGSTLVIAVEGFEITAVPTLTVDGGDIQLDTPKIVDGTVRVNVKKNSKSASTIKVAGLKGKALIADMPEDGLSLFLGGDALAGNYYDGKDKSVFDTFTADHRVYSEYILKTEKTTDSEVGFGNDFAVQLTLGSNIIQLSDGSTIVMDVAPEVKDNRTMLPLRWVGNAIGIPDEQIIWIPENQSIVVLTEKRVVQMQLNSNKMLITEASGGVKLVEMDVAPYLVNGNRTMLPIRWLSEALSLKVEWVPETMTVIIISVSENNEEVGVIPPALLDPTTFGLISGFNYPESATQIPNSSTWPTTGQNSVSEAETQRQLFEIFNSLFSMGTTN